MCTDSSILQQIIIAVSIFTKILSFHVVLASLVISVQLVTLNTLVFLRGVVLLISCVGYAFCSFTNNGRFPPVVSGSVQVLRWRNLKRSFVFTVRPTAHSNPPRKRSFLRTPFKHRFKMTGDCTGVPSSRLKKAKN